MDLEAIRKGDQVIIRPKRKKKKKCDDDMEQEAEGSKQQFPQNPPIISLSNPDNASCLKCILWNTCVDCGACSEQRKRCCCMNTKSQQSDKPKKASKQSEANPRRSIAPSNSRKSIAPSNSRKSIAPSNSRKSITPTTSRKSIAEQNKNGQSFKGEGAGENGSQAFTTPDGGKCKNPKIMVMEIECDSDEPGEDEPNKKCGTSRIKRIEIQCEGSEEEPE